MTSYSPAIYTMDRLSVEFVVDLLQVIEAYRKVQATKGKKKSPSKKEKEMFYKALKERDAIAKDLQRYEAQR